MAFHRFSGAWQTLMRLHRSWAKSGSDNKNIKVFIGAPASSNAAGTGYVGQLVSPHGAALRLTITAGPNTLGNFATDAQDSYSNFGGVMLWDARSVYLFVLSG